MISTLRILVAAWSLTAMPHHHARSRIVFGDVTVAAGEEVRTVVAIGGGVTLLPGSRAHDAMALGGSVEMAEGVEVQRDVTALGGDIWVGPAAHIGRNATTYGGAIEVQQGGSIAGTISPHPLADFGDSQEEEGTAETPLRPAWMVVLGLFAFLSFFAIGSFLLLIFPRQLDGVIDAFSQQPVRCFFVGVFATLLLPAFLVTLVITIIGILLIPGLLLAVALAGALGYGALALFIGRLIPIHTNDYAKLALGVLAVTLVSFIPVGGGMAWLFGWFLVFGGVLHSRFGTRPPRSPIDSPFVSRATAGA